MPYGNHAGRRAVGGRPKDRCPRCGGNMIRRRDQFGLYASCLQCGKTLDVNRLTAAELAELAARWRADETSSQADVVQ